MSTSPLHYTPTPPGQPAVSDPPFIHHVTIDRGVISLLQRWLPTYLGEMERREGRPTRFLARPTVYSTTYEEDDEDTFSNARLPTVLVTAGEATNWERDGDSEWAAVYRTAISIVCRGRSMPEARLQASMYAATVTALLLDKPGLEGLAGGIEVVSERARPVEDPSNRSRALTAGIGTYDIWVPHIRRGFSSPFGSTPPDDPDAVWPTPALATEVTVDVVGEPPPDPVGTHAPLPPEPPVVSFDDTFDVDSSASWHHLAPNPAPTFGGPGTGVTFGGGVMRMDCAWDISGGDYIESFTGAYADRPSTPVPLTNGMTVDVEVDSVLLDDNQSAAADEGLRAILQTDTSRFYLHVAWGPAGPVYPHTKMIDAGYYDADLDDMVTVWGPVPWSASAQRWLRVSLNADQTSVSWHTSPDGNAWTQVATLPAPPYVGTEAYLSVVYGTSFQPASGQGRYGYVARARLQTGTVS